MDRFRNGGTDGQAGPPTVVPRFGGTAQSIDGGGEHLPFFARHVRFLLFLAVLVILAASFAIYTYDPEVRHPAPPGETIFYPDVSSPMILGVAAVIGGVAFFFRWKSSIRSPRRIRFYRIAFAIPIIIIMSTIAIFKSYSNPQPRIIVSQSGIYCDHSVTWSHVSGVELRSARPLLIVGKLYINRPGKYAFIALDSDTLPLWGPAFQDQGGFYCELTDTNADYRTVFAVIQDAWRQTAIPREYQSLPDLRLSRPNPTFQDPH